MDRLFRVKLEDEITTSKKTEAGVPQGSVLGHVLYIIYTSNLSTSDNTTTTTFASDTAISATYEDPMIASMKFQATINKTDDWAKKWKIKINQRKSTHITFTLCNQTCLKLQTGNVDLPQKNEVEYLGMHLDKRLTWTKHIKSKRKQLNLKAKQMN
jgi:hypothetical protein